MSRKLINIYYAGPMAVTLTMAVLLAAGCSKGSPSGPDSGADVATITVSPVTTTVDNAFTLQFTATALDENGNPVGASFTWSVNSDSLGRISSNGVLTAGVFAPFTGNVTASSGGVSGSATVTVTVRTIGFAGDILPVFQSTCTTCHGTRGGLSLTSYSNLMAGNSNNGPVVIPGNPDGSIIWQKLGPTPPFGSRMPQGGSVAASFINKIYIWIRDGALNN